MEESVELGGNITLSGFSGRDFTELIVVKKIVGQYARKFTDGIPGFSRLAVTLKDVHGHEGGHGKSEIVVKVIIASQEYDAEVTEHNLYMALDTALKRVMEQAQKHLEMESHR
jgi:ribosome-associated translation inhibitor RaiA